MSAQDLSVATVLQEASRHLAASPQYTTWEIHEIGHQTRYEAEQLLLHVTGWTKLELLQKLSEPLPTALAHSYLDLVRTRKTGKPLSYILGYANFYGRVFRTRPGCLIPRPDTEVLIDTAHEWIRRHSPAAIAVDIGTGTGCIAVTLSLECPGVNMFAVDISDDAIQLAKENAALNNAAVTFVHTDGIKWLSNAAAAPGRRQLNVIISNPPYIPTDDVPSLEAGVREYEPMLALDGGPDGLDFYRSFASLPQTIFDPHTPAAFFFEVGAGQADDVASLFTSRDEWAGFSAQVIPDMRGIGRVVAVVREQ
jgi:release factor glutamine methyltransferase